MTRQLSTFTLEEKDKSEASGILTFVDIFLDSETLHFVNNDANISFFDLNGTPATYNALKMTREANEEALDMSIKTLVGGLDNIDQAMSAYISANSFRDKRIVIRACFRSLINEAIHAWKVFDGFMDKPQISKKEFRVELVPRLGRGTLGINIGVKQQILCRHPFAITGGRCAYGVSADDLKDLKAAQVVDSGSVSFIIDAARTEADDYWNFGYITFASNTLTTALRNVSRMIKDFVAAEDKVYPVYAFPTAPQAGDTYSIERGCDRTLDSCQNKFGNAINFGAIHSLPAEMVRR